AHGISFAVVSPQVDRLDQDELYRRSLTEPPHETVAAVLSSSHAIRPLSRWISSGPLKNWLVQRESNKLLGRLPGSLSPPTSWFVRISTRSTRSIRWAGLAAFVPSVLGASTLSFKVAKVPAFFVFLGSLSRGTWITVWIVLGALMVWVIADSFVKATAKEAED